MTKIIFLSVATVCWLCKPCVGQNIKINEICASNYISYEDDDDDFGDWVELYNAGGSTVNVGGMYITDDLTNLTKYLIPSTNPSETSIPSNGFLIIWFDDDVWKGVTHVAGKLNSNGEQVGLTASNGITIIDSVTFDKLLYDVSYGRTTDGSSSWSYFPVPTPDDNNTGGGYVGIAGKANFSVDAGFYPSSVQVELTYPDPTSSIYYSLNGNEPSPSRGILYTGPIQVDTNAVIRARVLKTNYVPGEVNTRSYFINQIHDLPVLSIVTDSANLWDEDIGIYTFGEDDYDHSYPYTGANFWHDWKRPAHIELFENSGAEAISQNVNLSISGNTSRGYAQKSMNMEAKDALGKANIPYQIFPQLPIGEYKAFKIRNGGSDWSSTGIRDAYNHTLIEGVTDVDYQANRPAIIYLNGQYWGWMNMTEKIDEDYLNEHFPSIDKDSVDLLYNNAQPIKGDATNYNDMLDFINNNSMANQSNYNYIKTQIDISNYINYMESRIYYAATDWPNNNIKFWRPKDLSMKWRWVMWDTDRSTMLHVSRPCNVDHNTLAWATTSGSVDAWARFLLNNLLLSSEFKRNFITQFAHHMNFTFCPARTDSILDTYRDRLAYELPAHIDRWEFTNDTIDYYSVGYYHSLAEWNTEVDTISMFFNGRADYVRDDIMNMFNIDDTYELNVLKVPPSGGTVMIDTFRVPSNACDLEYFEDYPVTLSAIPNPGYRFAGWTMAGGDTLPFSWNPDDDTTVTAYFIPTLANEPTFPSYSFTSSVTNCTDINLNWNSGNGTSRMVVAHAVSPVNDFPVDENEYTADAVFGSGDDLGNGNFVVYSGNGSSCVVTGLTSGVQYHFAIIEFNGTATTCNYNTNLYLSGSATAAAFNVAVAASVDSICAGSSSVLSAGGGVTYQWSPSTGLSSTTDSVVTATPGATITYSVLAVDLNGCESTAALTITVNDLPIVTLGSFSDICLLSSPITLTGGNPVGGVYSGNNVSSGIFDPVLTGATDITYTYTDMNGCTDSSTSSVTVLSLPVVTLGSLSDVCEDEAPVLLNGGFPAGGIYSGTGVSGNLFDPAIAGPGVHTVIYTYTDGNGCTDSASSGITVNGLPNVTLNLLSDVCIDHSPVILTGGLPTGGTYTGPGVSGIIFDPALAGTGLHAVAYTYTDGNGCTDSAFSGITVHGLPVVTLNLLIDACIDDSPVVLTGGLPAGGTYTGPGVSGIIFDPALAGTGLHAVAYTYTDGNGCTDSASSGITVHGLPVVTLNLLGDLCIDDSPVVLTGGLPAGGTYSGSGVAGNIFDPSVAGIGTFDIIYFYTDTYGCSNSDTSSVSVNDVPVISLGNDTTICVYHNILIDPGAGYSSYLWSTGATTQSILADSSGTGIGTATYQVTVTNAENCTAADDVLVTFDICAGIITNASPFTDVAVYPNPFRDEITISTNGNKIFIRFFDAYGKVILAKESESPFTVIRPDVSAGIYFLRIEATDSSETIKIIKTD